MRENIIDVSVEVEKYCTVFNRNDAKGSPIAMYITNYLGDLCLDVYYRNKDDVKIHECYKLDLEYRRFVTSEGETDA